MVLRVESGDFGNYRPACILEFWFAGDFFNYFPYSLDDNAISNIM